MMARGKNGKNSKTKTSKSLKPPPPPPVLNRGNDGKLIKSKVVYSNGPKVKSVKEIASAWCGLPTYRSTVPCLFQSTVLDRYAEAIIMAINQKNGAVPFSTGGLVYGKVRIYLLAAVYSHLAKIGAISTDSMKWTKYGKYRVPTSFALALQDLGTYSQPDSTASFTPEFAGLTEAYFDAYTSNEGSTTCPVVVGNNSSFGDEPYFGSGLLVTEIDDIDCDIISNSISSAMKTVQTQYIAKWANTSGAMASAIGYDTFGSVDRLSNVTPHISLSQSIVITSPCFTRIPNQIYGLNAVSVAESSGFVHTHVLLCMDIDYEYKMKPWSGFARFGVDPYDVQLSYPLMSFSALGGLVIDWLINIGIWTANASGTDSNFNNWLNLAYAYLLAKTPFPGRMSVAASQAPFYVSPSHLRVGMPSCIGNIGMMVTRACNTIIIPAWPGWDSGKNCMNTFVSGNVYTPLFGDITGQLPFSGTIPGGVTLGGLTQPSTSNIYNACYLALKEEIQNAERSTVNNQTVEFDINKPYCPCSVSQNAGSNYNLNSFVLLPATSVMCCSRTVGAIDCRSQMGVCLDIRTSVTSYYKTLSDATQNRFRVVTEAAKFGNNVTQLVSTNSGAAWKQATSGYLSNLSSSIKWEKGVVTGADLIRAAHHLISEGGSLDSIPDASFWSSFSVKDYNLEELVSKVASGINYVTPAVRAALSAYRAIRVHYPSD